MEFINPITHSIKDRTALALLESLGEPSKGVVEASSGNLAVALASMLRARGVDFTAYIPRASPRAYKVMLKLLGVQVVERNGSTTDMLTEVREVARRLGLIHPDQFSNPANYRVHYMYTAREIDEQVKAAGFRPRYIVGSVGTAGHMVGVSMYFKERYGDSIKIIVVQPKEGSPIPGIKRLREDNPFAKMLMADEVVEVSKEQAMVGVIHVARGDGLLIGLSSGAVAYAAMKMSIDDAVLIFPDDAWHYVDDPYLGELADMC